MFRTMQSNRLPNSNLFTFHQINKYFNSNSSYQKMSDNSRWKKPVSKPAGIDSVKPVVSGMKSVELQKTDLKSNEIRTLSLEVKLANTKPKTRIKSLLNTVKVGFGNNSYFEPETKSFKYQLSRWFSLNWFVLTSVLVLTISFSLVILLIFRA